MPDCAAPLETTARPRAARGPFRPDAWLNARERSGLRLAAHYFRVVDIVAVLAAGGIILAAQAVAAQDGLAGLGELSVATVGPSALFAGLYLFALRSFSLYRFDRNKPALRHVLAILAVGAGATVVAALPALIGNRSGLQAVINYGLIASLTLAGLHTVWLTLVRGWRAKGLLSPNIVIVGASRHAEVLIKQALERRDLNVLGVFDDRLARSPDSVEGVPVLGNAAALLRHRMTPYVDHVVLAIDAEGGPRIRELRHRLQSLPNPMTVLVDADGVPGLLRRLSHAPLAPLEVISAERKAFNKRMLDLVLGLIGLVVISPLMALIALAVRLDSPGPIFFRQRRHGFNQEEIVVWKFRSMRHDAADATASRQVTAGDDRVTRVGRFIRATSLDELPQIFNVISGEMSLVGPRPHAIGMKTGDTESARLVAEYAQRHRIKPGMTGWAAIKGSRGPVDTEEAVRRRVQLDLDYIERQSFWLDLWIVCVTIPVLLGDRAAVR